MANKSKSILIGCAFLLAIGACVGGGIGLSKLIGNIGPSNPVEEVSKKSSSSAEETSYEVDEDAVILGVAEEASLDSTLIRTHDAADLTITVDSTTGTIASDFDNYFPYSEIKDVTKDGNKMVYIPKHYTRYTYNTETKQFRTEISDKKGDGFIINPCFLDDEGEELDGIYVGKYTASGATVTQGEGSEQTTVTKAVSVSGAAPLVNITHEGFRDAALLNGEGYGMIDIWTMTMIQDLWKIEFATTNSQSIMQGRVNASNAANSGSTDSLGENKSGWSLSTGAMNYRGIENLWGNVWQWLDGLTFSNGSAYVCYDRDSYASGSTSSPYVRVGYTLSGVGNQQRHGFDVNNPFVQLNVETNGTDTANGGYYCDYFNASNACPLVGGSWYFGSGAGLWAVVSDSVSFAASSIGGRLLLK